jgi:RimJ/RimL family protein N-acetyltransferase
MRSPPVELRPAGDAAQVSYLVAAGLRGQSIAPRALDAFLSWAARDLGLRRAFLTCHVANAASQGVAA